MAIGILVGAWVLQNCGWRGVWAAAFSASLLAVIDMIYGADLGLALGQWMRAVLEGGGDD